MKHDESRGYETLLFERDLYVSFCFPIFFLRSFVFCG